jgi:hypothetical protein
MAISCTKLTDAFKQIATVSVVLSLSLAIRAQEFAFDFAPLSPENVPATGTYWLAQGPDGQEMPPFPYPPLGLEVPIYDLGRGQFFVDNSDGNDELLFQRMSALPAFSLISSSIELPDDEEGGGEPGPAPLVDPRRNAEKFAAHGCWVIDTNSAALDETNLYNACLSFPADTNTAANLQIAPFGPDAVIIKANHFDFSGETERDFVLLVCDKVESSVWKSIDLSGVSDSIDGWLIQGFISRHNVTDPMFLMVTNTALDATAFFRVIPYRGPLIQIAGGQPNETVSNTIALHAEISDLSGATNQQLIVLVDGIEPRYSLGASNTITIETPYTPNGPVTVSATVFNETALIFDPTNAPMDTKSHFVGSTSVPLDFENATYVYFQADNSDPSIGTNYVMFGVTPPQNIDATITEPSSGRLVKSFSGYNASYSYVALDWNFTESDGVTPFTNDEYLVTFTASDPPLGSDVRTLTVTNKVQRNGVRRAGWVISTFEEVTPSKMYSGYSGSFMNSELARWGDATGTMYETLDVGDFASQTQYYPSQIGANRDTPGTPHMPTRLNPTTEAGWPALIQSLVTNRSYSDFNYGPGHGNGYAIGGGEYDSSSTIGHWRNYVNTKIFAADMAEWAQAGSFGTGNTNKDWRMRKVSMWACYTARVAGQRTAGAGLYSNWHQAFGIDNTAKQMRSLKGKNAGLYFDDELAFGGYDPNGVPTDVAEVAATFDKMWVMGANPYPGGADPNYSIQFAYGVTEMLFPELTNASPVLDGFFYLPFAGVYDDQLKVNDISQVKP